MNPLHKGTHLPTTAQKYELKCAKVRLLFPFSTCQAKRQKRAGAIEMPEGAHL